MFIAVRTGLEPATPGVTGRYSNQSELPHRIFSLLGDAKIRIYYKTANFYRNFVLLSAKLPLSICLHSQSARLGYVTY